jgi:hypothetical protein
MQEPALLGTLIAKTCTDERTTASFQNVRRADIGIRLNNRAYALWGLKGKLK